MIEDKTSKASWGEIQGFGSDIRQCNKMSGDVWRNTSEVEGFVTDYYSGPGIHVRGGDIPVVVQELLV